MLGNKIAALRKQRGLSQYELADRLGFSRGKLANYEQGSREPDYETLSWIASYFETTVDFLLGRTEDEAEESNRSLLSGKLVNLEKERTRMGWTQEEASTRAGVARSTYANWENGKREPDFDTAQKLAALFEVSVDYLLGQSKFRNADELATKYIQLNGQHNMSVGENPNNYETSVGRAFFGGAEQYTEEELEIARAAAEAAIKAYRKTQEKKKNNE